MTERVPRARWVLPVVLAGTFMAILDVAIVNVAIPSIREDLHASFGNAELVISAYTLAYACLLVTGGRLGDLYGRQRMFIVDPRFVAQWEAFLRRLGTALGAPDSSGAPPPHPTDAAAI